MNRFKIYNPEDIDLIDGPIDEDYYSREYDKCRRIIMLYNQRNDGLTSLNQELNNLCFKARLAQGYAREAYIRQARALRLIIVEIVGE